MEHEALRASPYSAVGSNGFVGHFVSRASPPLIEATASAYFPAANLACEKEVRCRVGRVGGDGALKVFGGTAVVPGGERFSRQIVQSGRFLLGIHIGHLGLHLGRQLERIEGRGWGGRLRFDLGFRQR